MKRSRDVTLSPHHMGEALVAALFNCLGAQLRDILAFNPMTGKLEQLGALLPSLSEGVRIEARPKVHLDPIEGGLSFDGMHDVDCAVVVNERVTPFELKLGITRMTPEEFNRRFSSVIPKLTHKGTRVSGTMVGILDRNGMVLEKREDVKLLLHADKKPVDHRWALVVPRLVLDHWSGEGMHNVSSALGVENLAAILTLEGITDSVGIKEARQVAIDLMKESVDKWFAD